jgi:hypothetical protein
MLRKLFLIGLLATGVALAQRGGGGGGGMGGGGMTEGMPRASTNRMDRMSEALKLNKDQKKEIKGILDEGQKEAAPLRDQMSKARLAIAGNVDEGKSQDEITQAVNAYAGLEMQMTQIEMKSFAKIYQTLDKDQQAKAGVVYQMMAGIFKGKNWNE